ncbi:MAG: S1 RNA-binding domain-containing protein, partial [Lachnospiraceae bacterium]|nr:S1 RNA-binding domain-containing protein [Lachnospiraceae bacterium]
CEVSSKNERRADGAERQVEKMKKAEYMESYIGEEFDGSVSGLTSWGIYVMLQNGIEGMIPLRYLHDDHYIFDEETYETVGQYKNFHFYIGMPVRICVAAVDRNMHTIDFELAQSATAFVRK